LILIKFSEEKVEFGFPTQDLRIRILVIGHCLSSGHRGGDTTAQVINEYFWWNSISEDCRNFVKGCLHCLLQNKFMLRREMLLYTMTSYMLTKGMQNIDKSLYLKMN
jgi:hypothetical protein